PSATTRGGGVFGAIAHVLSQTPKDVADVAVHAPGGIYHLGKTIVEGDVGVLTGNERKQQQASDEIGAAVHADGRQLNQERQHPLRHPGNTLIDALAALDLGAGSVARGAEATRAVRAGEGFRGAARGVVRGPAPEPRVVRLPGDREVQAGTYSRAASS